MSTEMTTSATPFALDPKAAAAAYVAQAEEITKDDSLLILKLPSTANGGRWLDSKSGQPFKGQIAIDPMGFEHGWIVFKQGQFVMENVCSVFDDLPEPPVEGDDYKAPADVNQTMKVKAATSEGRPVMISGSSAGLKNAVRDLRAAILERVKAGEAKFTPVCELGTSSYMHKGNPAKGYAGGKITTPVFEVVGWV